MKYKFGEEVLYNNRKHVIVELDGDSTLCYKIVLSGMTSNKYYEAMWVEEKALSRVDDKKVPFTCNQDDLEYRKEQMIENEIDDAIMESLEEEVY